MSRAAPTYIIIIRDYDTRENLEYSVKGDDMEIISKESEEGYDDLMIKLEGKVVFTCSLAIVKECYRKDALIGRKEIKAITVKRIKPAKLIKLRD